MKIIVDYSSISGNIIMPDGAIYITCPNMPYIEYVEPKLEEVKNETSKLTINDLIDLKRANVI